jgi:hypothetical protein
MFVNRFSKIFLIFYPLTSAIVMTTTLIAVGVVVVVSRVVVTTLSATICSNKGRAKVIVVDSVISAVGGVSESVAVVSVHHSF